MMSLGRVLIVFATVLGALQFSAMAQTKLTSLAPGSWGGRGVNVIVEKSGVLLEYDCAEGRIPTVLQLNRSGRFVAEGFHKRQSPGPIRLNLQPKEQPARFEGRIVRGSMQFKVVIIATGEVIGEFSAVRGREGLLRKCR